MQFKIKQIKIRDIFEGYMDDEDNKNNDKLRKGLCLWQN